MGAKHGKYAYVNTGSTVVKIRILKSREEKDAERYLVLSRVKRVPRKGVKINLSDLPLEVRDKVIRM
jgi:hypothetical protein